MNCSFFFEKTILTWFLRSNLWFDHVKYVIVQSDIWHDWSRLSLVFYWWSSFLYSVMTLGGNAKKEDIGKNFSSFFIWLFSSGWWWWLKGHSTAAAKSLVWRHPCHSGSRSSSLYFKHLQLSDCILLIKITVIYNI